MKRVGILTDFTQFDFSYSLCLCAGDQISMLLRGGYEPIFIACEGFKKVGPIDHEKVDLRFIPNYHRSNRAELDDNWEEDIAGLEAALDEALDGVDVCLSHDVVYQNASLKLNIAARRVAKKRPDLRWLHWVHSATRPGFLSSSQGFLEAVTRKFPNSFIVYPNPYELPRVARNFGYEENEVKCVFHPIDVCGYMGFHDLTTRMVNEFDLLSADAIGVYPVRLDRGKQVEYCVRTFAQLKRLGRSVRLIVMDFHSTGGDKVVYRNQLKKLGIDQGLNQRELIFTSEFSTETHLSCPRAVVRDLMFLCNVYMHPSVSETFSLTTQEAALNGAFLILNWDWPAMRSIYGKNAIYTGFSSDHHSVGHFWEENTERNYGGAAEGDEGVDAFAYDIANRIAYELDNNMVLAQQRDRRQNFNLDAVFKNQLQPLLYAREGGDE